MKVDYLVENLVAHLDDSEAGIMDVNWAVMMVEMKVENWAEKRGILRGSFLVEKLAANWDYVKMS